MFEERKANVSETSKEIVDSAFRKIDLEKYAIDFAERISDLEMLSVPETINLKYGFIEGAKYMRNSAWHTDKEPFVERDGKQMVVLVYRDGELIFSTIKYAKEFNCFYNQNKLSYDLFRYAYIEDLIPIG